MRIFVLAAALGAMLVPAAADAQNWRGDRGWNNDRGYGYGQSRECRRALRYADTRWEYRRAQRICREARYDRRDRWRNDDRGWRNDDRRWRDNDRDWRNDGRRGHDDGRDRDGDWQGRDRGGR
jgi:hypothetical protein